MFKNTEVKNFLYLPNIHVFCVFMHTVCYRYEFIYIYRYGHLPPATGVDASVTISCIPRAHEAYAKILVDVLFLLSLHKDVRQGSCVCKSNQSLRLNNTKMLISVCFFWSRLAWKYSVSMHSYWSLAGRLFMVVFWLWYQIHSVASQGIAFCVVWFKWNFKWHD